MRRPELLVRLLLGLLIAGAVSAPLWARSRSELIHARMADSGGWSPDVLRARVGQPLHLRLTSDDVMHGFAVGQMDMRSVDVEPGKVTDVILSFSKPGTYTFYCTRWCGLNHWRMRGTIEVTGDEVAPAPVTPPLYVQLGLQVDAPHEAGAIPSQTPSAEVGRPLHVGWPLSAFAGTGFYRSHSPYETWGQLRDESALAGRSDAELWDMVAFIWQSNTTPENVAQGKQLFEQNCAACHGLTGRGDGVFADQLAAQGAAGGVNMMVQRPANLADTKRMLGASPALLEGKILRGGMGTGMPSWGPILKESDIWNIVSHLYTFQFKEFTP
jgi:mono/diheme cytochrome c family protein/plastocyanin